MHMHTNTNTHTHQHSAEYQLERLTAVLHKLGTRWRASDQAPPDCDVELNEVIRVIGCVFKVVKRMEGMEEELPSALRLMIEVSKNVTQFNCTCSAFVRLHRAALWLCVC